MRFSDDRSTMLLTDEAGTPWSMSYQPVTSYTAFGEPVWTDANTQTVYVGTPLPAGFPTRYQYAGGWGYESDLIRRYGTNPELPPITLQHVGARWYDPALGRFVQRDPIGLAGGPNVYLYCDADPTAAADPPGMSGGAGDGMHPRDYWERMRRYNKAIADQLKKAWDKSAGARSLARQRLAGAIKARNALYLSRFGPMSFVCVYVAEKAIEAIDEVRQWRPEIRQDGPPRAGEWRQYLE